MVAWLQQLPWTLVILLCLTLGLAPFTPPHLWEKLNMLFHGNLTRPIDWFDLFLHGSPWAVLVAKAVASLMAGSHSTQ